MCGGSGEDGYGRDCWKFDGNKYTQTNGTKYARDYTSEFDLIFVEKLTENSMSDHYFGDMVGHFGAFSKYGALMIAGKNDDRGATEFYDN